MLNLISQSQEAAKTSLKVSLMAVMVSLAACGGGGSEGFYGGGTPTPTPPTPTPLTAVNITNVEVYDLNNVLTRTVTAAGATAKVKVTDSFGKGISGALVTFTSAGVAFGTSNGAVLTNADGEASIAIKPLNSSDTGSYELLATVAYDGLTDASAPYNFSLQAVNIALANFAVGGTFLESGASTNVTLKTQDAITSVNQNNVAVNFSTSCGVFEPATVISSNQGDVTTTYKSIDTNGKLCEGKQTLTAAVSNASATKSVDVTIAAITANALVYSTANAVNMGTKNSGSASSGQIEFTVYANGTPATNQSINIDLVRGPVDLSFVTEGNRTTKTLKSDAAGKVLVSLFPGSLPGPVEIKATLTSNTGVFVLSKNVAVATGRASQQGLSISMSKNALSTDVDRDIAEVQAMLVDRVGNPVPDGTVISFVAEGGSIDPNCATVNGSCVVELRTQNPRPAPDNRVSVLAYIEGDKSFTDIDGDNMYTAGIDKLTNNIGDFFRDDNENNIHEAGEYVYKRGDSGATCAVSTINHPNIAGTCSNELDAVLRQQVLFAFSHETPTFVGLSGIDEEMTNITNSRFVFQIFGNNIRTVPMPSGTKISVVAKDRTPDNKINCDAEIFGDVTVPDVVNLLTPSTFPLSSNNGTKYQVISSGCAPGDNVRIIVVAPNKETTYLIPF